jgi:hypothetical protein
MLRISREWTDKCSKRRALGADGPSASIRCVPSDWQANNFRFRTEAYSRASNIFSAGGDPSSEKYAEEVKRALVRLLDEATRHCDELDACDVCAVSVEAINDAVDDTGWPQSVKLII